MGSARSVPGTMMSGNLPGSFSHPCFLQAGLTHRLVSSPWSQTGPRQCHSVSSANPKWKSEGKPSLGGSGDPITGVLVNQSWPTCAQLQGQRKGRDGPPEDEMLLFNRVGMDAGDGKTTNTWDTPQCPPSQAQRTSFQPHQCRAPCSHSVGH